MKILYVTTIGGTTRFFKDFIKLLLSKGHTVDFAANETTSEVKPYYREWGCKIHQISCTRSPFNKGSIKAIKEIKKIVEENNYDIVHCHTPIAAMCTRLACIKARKKGTKVFYTAHGFHFYKGAPLKNWIMYYPIEKICSYFTDLLITINKEDYTLAQKKLKAKKVVYVPGVGIDLETFKPSAISKEEKRKELGIPQDAKLLISVGELNSNKNHETVIKAIKDLDVYYVVAGNGGLQSHLQSIIDETGMTDRVKLLGFRTDMSELYTASDVFVFPSFREGLSVSLMEAMASGKPCVVSKIRGNTDLIDENGGFYFNPYNVNECSAAIQKVLNSDIDSMSQYNLEKVKKFSLDKVINQLKGLYFDK